MEKQEIIDFKESVVRASSSQASQVRFIQDRKQLALSKLEDLDFPSKREEAWKYFDLNDILSESFETQSDSNIEAKIDKKAVAKLIDKYVYRETVTNLLVTINGAYSKEFSNFNFEELAANGLKILNFNNPEELNSDSELKSIVEKLFAKNIESEDRYFKAVNTVLMQNGFLLYAKDGFTSDVPLQVLHISNHQHSFNQIRSLIYAGKNSKIDLIVNYIGLEDKEYLTNSVIECFVEENASVKLEKIQNESKKAVRLYSFNADLAANSNFEYHSFNFGAKSNREDVEVNINGEGAEATVNGLYVLEGDRKSHHKVIVNHNAAHSQSHQLYKGILKDEARAEFNGLIEVARDAQKTDADQLNKNLLLSKDSHVDSRPQLNIFADDVKCAHGSTVGRLSDDELFYLQSRGLTKEDAHTVLTYSFCRELINGISIDSARNYASNLAFKNMNGEQEETFAELADNSKFKQGRHKE